MYKVIMGDDVIYCEKYIESSHSLRLINKYTYAYTTVTTSSSLTFNYHEFTKTLKDVLLLDPSKIKIEEFDFEEFRKLSLIFNIDLKIELYKDMIETHEEFIEYKTRFITKHTNKWYSIFMKNKLDSATDYIVNTTEMLKENYSKLERLEKVKTLETFDDMYNALKLV